MAFHLKIEPKAEKQLNNIPEPYHSKILVSLASIALNPWVGKKLKGKYAGSYSLKAWPYRIIYDIYKNNLLILVIKIKHRGGAYN